MNLHDFKDIHTHNLQAAADAVICLPLFAPIPPGGFYSVGVHPWDTAMLSPAETDRAMMWVESLAADERVVAIGEAGIDKLRGASVDEQTVLFLRHVAVSEAVGKPLVIHAVRSLPQLMQLRKKLQPKQLWIIHGYRGNAETARQLVQLGFGISLGERYNPDVPAAVPADRLFHETD